jgi:hypothetical protein
MEKANAATLGGQKQERRPQAAAKENGLLLLDL